MSSRVSDIKAWSVIERTRATRASLIKDAAIFEESSGPDEWTVKRDLTLSADETIASGRLSVNRSRVEGLPPLSTALQRETGVNPKSKPVEVARATQAASEMVVSPGPDGLSFLCD